MAVLFAGETVLGASSAGTSSLRLGGAAGDAAAGPAAVAAASVTPAPGSRRLLSWRGAPAQIDERKGGEAHEDADDEADNRHG